MRLIRFGSVGMQYNFSFFFSSFDVDMINILCDFNEKNCTTEVNHLSSFHSYCIEKRSLCQSSVSDRNIFKMIENLFFFFSFLFSCDFYSSWDFLMSYEMERNGMEGNACDLKRIFSPLISFHFISYAQHTFLWEILLRFPVQ